MERICHTSVCVIENQKYFNQICWNILKEYGSLDIFNLENENTDINKYSDFS